MMRSLPLLTLVLSQGVLAQIDCSGDVNVENLRQARQVGESCETIEGDLTFSNVTETISIQGLRTVRGTVSHGTCPEGSTGSSPCSAQLSIDFPDLREVEGDLDFHNSPGIRNLSLPELRVVNGTLTPSGDMVDLSSLQYIGALRLEQRSMDDLRLDSLIGFATSAKDGGIVKFLDWGAPVESIEHVLNQVFNRTMKPASEDSWPSVEINIDTMDLDQITLAWEKVEDFSLNTNALDWKQVAINFGGPETETMEIRNMSFENTGGSFNRHDALQKLNVGSYTLYRASGPSDLVLDFNGLEELVIEDSDSIRSLQLPQAAENWNGLSISITENTGLSLATNSGTNQIWYWPKEMGDLIIVDVEFEEDFFDAFIDRATQVSGTFQVSDLSSGLDCEIFNGMAGENLPEDYSCETEKEGLAAGPLAVSQSLTLGLTAVVTLAMVL